MVPSSSTKLLPPSFSSPRNNVPLSDIGEIAQYLDHLEDLDNATLREVLRLAEALEKVEARERNQTEFLPFVKSVWPSFVEGYHHKVVAKLFEDIASGRKKRLIVCMAPRHPYHVDTPVLTTDGWKTIGSTEVGDFVFGLDGSPVKVLGKSGRMIDTLYQITTDDGDAILATGEHRWSVLPDRKRIDYQRVMTSEQIAVRQSSPSDHKRRALMLPPTSGPDLPRAELPIDPYVLGYWLGDGHSSQGIITSADEDSRFVRDEFKRRGQETTDQSTPMTFGVVGLKVRLRDLGILGNKMVPDIYMMSSRAQRLDLLRGLMDSDGTVSESGQCFFTQKSDQLRRQFRELLWSLGVKNSEHFSEVTGFGRSWGLYGKVSFYLRDSCLLPRKRARTRDGRNRRYIRSRRTEDVGEVQCLQVASEDEIFLVGKSCIPGMNTKSEFASYLFPAWFMGRFPNKKIIQATHTGELSVNFGRKVRDLIGTKEYQSTFPGVALKADTKAAGRWNTSLGGEYWSVGVGAALAGKGADLFVIDDAHSEQDGMATDQKAFEKAYEWYTSGPRQRLQPNGAIVIVMCMTGDTNVLMADGCNKLLRDIRPGDEVATYDNGTISTSRVTNWINQGPDYCFAIKTISGIIIKANERHPFLVELDNGDREWVRVRDLKPGMDLVRVNPDITASGGGRLAKWTGAPSRLTRRGSVDITTKSRTGLRVGVGARWPANERHTSSTATGSRRKITTGWLRSRVELALSALSRQAQATLRLVGNGWLSTIAMKLARFVDSSVTTVISSFATGMASPDSFEPSSTSDFTADRILEITPCGREDVFDIEVERTENFIANGAVASNTRWNKGDLVGRILKKAAEEGDDEWDLVELPAILPSGTPIWPEYWSLEELLKIKRDIPPHKWNAQYMQEPTGGTGTIIKPDWWRRWPDKVPPKVSFVMQSWDTAFSAKNKADFSAVTTWGVFTHPDDKGRPCTNIILLDAKKRRVEFPDLKTWAREEHKQWDPDILIIEGRLAGLPLIQELRAAGIPVQSYTPGSGADKIARVNAIADLFASGIIWVPERQFANELIEEFSDFPAGIHDDLVDSATQALMRFRQGGLIQLSSDDDWTREEYEQPYARYY